MYAAGSTEHHRHEFSSEFRVQVRVRGSSSCARGFRFGVRRPAGGTPTFEPEPRTRNANSAHERLGGTRNCSAAQVATPAPCPRSRCSMRLGEPCRGLAHPTPLRFVSDERQNLAASRSAVSSRWSITSLHQPWLRLGVLALVIVSGARKRNQNRGRAEAVSSANVVAPSDRPRGLPISSRDPSRTGTVPPGLRALRAGSHP